MRQESKEEEMQIVLLHCMECRRGLAMRILSVRRTCGLRQNERKISQNFYTIRKIIYPSFLRKRMVGGGDPFYLKFGSTDPRWSKITG